LEDAPSARFFLVSGLTLLARPGGGVLEKARAIGYLAGIALKAIDAGNLTARIEMLEAVLKHLPSLQATSAALQLFRPRNVGREKAASALSLGAAAAGGRDRRQGGARPRPPPSAAIAGTVPCGSRLGR
jgi:hypothetical protein